MGFYVNPENGMTKERWLETYGDRVSEDSARQHSAGFQNKLAVCLVDNGWMTAAGIAYDDHERNAFMHPDTRTKKWFLVPKALLDQFLPS